MSQTPIELKGSNFTLSVLYIYDASPHAIRFALQKKIQEAHEFLKNAPVVINVSGLSRKTNWNTVFQIISDISLHIVGVSGCNDSYLKNQIINSGFPILKEGKAKNCNIYHTETPKLSKTKWISLPVRSGQKIFAKNCDLIVTNSVSSGAELIADGNIHIYGTLRGRVLAGASGDKECQIFCTCFFPEIVSLAGQYWLCDQIPIEHLGKSVRISLKHSMLTIQPLI